MLALEKLKLFDHNELITVLFVPLYVQTRFSMRRHMMHTSYPEVTSLELSRGKLVFGAQIKHLWEFWIQVLK